MALQASLAAGEASHRAASYSAAASAASTCAADAAQRQATFPRLLSLFLCACRYYFWHLRVQCAQKCLQTSSCLSVGIFFHLYGIDQAAACCQGVDNALSISLPVEQLHTGEEEHVGI